MFPAARLDLTTDVLQHSKLDSETTHYNYNYNYNNNYYNYYYNTDLIVEMTTTLVTD